jgi:hypothetical protein
MSPKTYRKYRDKWSSRHEIEYNKYKNELRKAIRNFMLWNVPTFTRDGMKEKKTWNSNEDAFLKLMEDKDIPYIVDCVQECFEPPDNKRERDGKMLI